MLQKNLTLRVDAMSLWTGTLDLFSSMIAYISKLWMDFEEILRIDTVYLWDVKKSINVWEKSG